MSNFLKQVIVGLTSLIALSFCLFSQVPEHLAIGLVFSGGSLGYLIDLSDDFPKPGRIFAELLAIISIVLGLGCLLYFGLKML